MKQIKKNEYFNLCVEILTSLRTIFQNTDINAKLSKHLCKEDRQFFLNINDQGGDKKAFSMQKTGIVLPPIFEKNPNVFFNATVNILNTITGRKISFTEPRELSVDELVDLHNILQLYIFHNKP